MCFRVEIQRILKQVITDDPFLGPVYLSKVGLADAYMRLWVRMDEVPSVALLIPKKNPRKTQLVGFHLSLPMGSVDSDPYFCMATETVPNLENKAILQREKARKHLLELADKARAVDDSGAPEAQADASWEHLPAEHRSTAMANTNVCLEEFISVVQGGPRERRQMLLHLFNNIDWVSCSNKEAYTNRKYPIY